MSQSSWATPGDVRHARLLPVTPGRHKTWVEILKFSNKSNWEYTNQKSKDDLHWLIRDLILTCWFNHVSCIRASLVAGHAVTSQSGAQGWLLTTTHHHTYVYGWRSLIVTFLMWSRATAALVQAVLLSRPGSETVSGLFFLFRSSQCLLLTLLEWCDRVLSDRVILTVLTLSSSFTLSVSWSASLSAVSVSVIKTLLSWTRRTAPAHWSRAARLRYHETTQSEDLWRPPTMIRLSSVSESFNKEVSSW